MIITFECPSCQSAIEADNTLFGTVRSCPSCEIEVEVPAAHVGPGVELGGFRIEDRLGRGGMGEVFLAEQLSMSRTVALKVLPPEMTTNKEAVERFLHEARMSARLEHPNIVTVLDAGEDCGFYYLAMNYVDGYTLDDRVKREKTIPEAEVLAYGKKVLAALDHAWTHHHILHRDIKPANVMIDKYGEVKLLDMGLAKAILEDSHLTISGTIVGTPYYMSPEQAKSQKQLDFRADLYSVGATLYHLLCGSPPFEGDSVVTILTQHVLEDVPPVQARNPEVSDACASLMEVMLAKKPEDRYDSYAAAISDFDRVLAGEMPAAETPAAQPKKKGVAFKRKPSNLVPPPARPVDQGAVTMDASAPQQPAFARGKKNPLVAAIAGFVTIFAVAALAIGVMMVVFQGPDGGENGTDDQPPDDLPPVVDTLPDDDDGPPPGWDDHHQPDADEMARRAAEVAREISEIRQFQKANPLQFDEALHRYQGLAAMAAGTPHHEAVLTEIREVRREREAAVTKVMGRLVKRVRDRVEAGETEEAARMLQEYDGPFAAITERKRQEAAERILDSKRRDDEARAAAEFRRREEAMAHFESRYLEITENLIRQDFAAARNQLVGLRREAEIKPVRREVLPLIDLAAEVAQMDNLVTASFKQNAGKIIPVRLKDDREQLVIDSVADGKVKASRLIKDKSGKVKGRIGRSFGYGDLSADEKVRRLGQAEGDAKHAMKAILYVEIGKAASAMKTLSRMESAACVAFASHIGNAVPLGFRYLLRAVPLPEDEEDLRALQRKVSRMEFDDAKEHEIRLAAATFLRRHGDQPECEPYRRFAEHLAHLGDETPDRSEHRTKTGAVVPGPGNNKPGLKGQKPHAVPAEFVDPRHLGRGADQAVELQRQTVKLKQMPLEIQNSLGMRFRLIPVAAYWGYPGEAPDKVYYMSKFEVTQEQWQAIFKHHRFQNPNPKHAADNLIYDDIQRFIKLLCEREGLPVGSYRLPTDEEWTYACRAGTRSKYSFGDDPGRFPEFANYLDSTAPPMYGGVDLRERRDQEHSDGNSRVARAGSYKPNPWGLYDMYGNLWEYVSDVSKYGNFHAVKGGSWLDTGDRLRATGRLMVDVRARPDPKLPQPYGFRLVLEPPKTKVREPDNRWRPPRDRRPFKRFR